MSIAKCPNCLDEIRLPFEISPDDLFKCPLCDWEFDGETILKRVPPAVSVIKSSSGSKSASAGGFAINTGNAGGAMGGQFDFDGPSSSGGSPRANSNASEPRNSGSKSEKNMVIEGLKIVGGGALAIPIVVLVGWWIGGIDPFSLGPGVGKVAPFIVPKALRSDAETEEEQLNMNDGSNEFEKGEFAQNDIEKKSKRVKPNSNFKETSGSKGQTGLVKSDVAKGIKQAKAEREGLATNVGKGINGEWPPRLIPRKKNENVLTELSAAAFAVQPNADATWDRYFKGLCKAAEYIGGRGTTDATGSGVDSTTNLLLDQLEPAGFTELQLACSRQLNSRRKKNTGVAVAGKLKSKTRNKDFYEASIAVNESQKVTVITKNGQYSAYEPGNDLFVLGVFIDNANSRFKLNLDDQLVVAEIFTKKW